MVKKIVFMGTPQFSVPILEALAEKEDYRIEAVVTQPDRKVGRKKKVTPPPVKQAAEKLGLTVLQPEKITGSEEMEKIIELKPDLIVTAAFGQFLPTKLLNAPKYRAINVHASLLPKYRGAAPIHYAIINGEQETGVTIMYMEKKMDAGDILSQRSIPITKQDDVGSMFEKLSFLGRDLLIDTLPDLFEESITPIPQAEEEVTYAPMIHSEQELIDWNQTAEELDCKVRGMRPFPGAFTYLEENRFKIWGVEPTTEQTSENPGTIVEVGKETLKVACGDGSVLNLTKVQPSGKPKMDVKDYLAGAGLEKGIQFG
jgi:methionyl-tRNA formyltransferase